MFANPFLIKNPAKVAAELSPLLGRDQSELLPQLADDDKGFVYLRRKLDPDLGDKIEKLRSRASARSPSRAAPTRRARWPPSCWARSAPTATGWRASSSSTRTTLHGEDGKRRLVKDATGKPVSLVETKRAGAGRRPAA